MSATPFPLRRVVGQTDAKMALLVAAADPRIGGVLLRGQKGSAKTTLARGLAAHLGDRPFVEVPLGVTEDRLVGSIDAGAALTGAGVRFRAGLLAAAHGGVLYVDEVNLLADHLVDLLLDVTVSGENFVERDGMSHRHDARFVLIGSMNPEEGELRPQLLDRFGFCVTVAAPAALDDRIEVLRRRLAHDGARVGAGGSPAVARRDDDVAMFDIQNARPAELPAELLEAAARAAIAVGAEGLRADLTLCRGAAALAGLEGRSVAELADLRRVAPLVLAHRRRRGPFDPPVVAPEELDDAINGALGPDRSAVEGDRPAQPDATGDAPDEDRPLGLGGELPIPVPNARTGSGPRGRVVRDEPMGPAGGVSVLATARALAHRRAEDPDAELDVADLRADVRVAPRPRTVVLCVDLSGSMGAHDRARAATGTAIGLLTGAYQRRERVALVGFRGADSEILLAPTASIEVARNRLADLATGGPTPLAGGIARGLEVAFAATADGGDALLAVVTDGRATGADGAFDAALAAAATVRARGIPALVLDVEFGKPRLRLAERLAAAMGARYVDVEALDPDALLRAIRDGDGRGPS